MPDLLTHLYIANTVKKKLGVNDAIYWGAFGPDPFYYYHFYITNKKWRDIADMLHMRSEALVDRASLSRTHSEFSYYVGLITHFITDETFHPYIEEVTEKKGGKSLVHKEFEIVIDRIVSRKFLKEYRHFFSLLKKTILISLLPFLKDVFKDIFLTDHLIYRAFMDEILYFKLTASSDFLRFIFIIFDILTLNKFYSRGIVAPFSCRSFDEKWFEASKKKAIDNILKFF